MAVAGCSAGAAGAAGVDRPNTERAGVGSLCLGASFLGIKFFWLTMRLRKKKQKTVNGVVAPALPVFIKSQILKHNYNPDVPL